MTERTALRRYTELTAEERASSARWLRLRWACSGDELQAIAALRLILDAERTLVGRLQRSAS